MTSAPVLTVYWSFQCKFIRVQTYLLYLECLKIVTKIPFPPQITATPVAAKNSFMALIPTDLGQHILTITTTTRAGHRVCHRHCCNSNNININPTAKPGLGVLSRLGGGRRRHPMCEALGLRGHSAHDTTVLLQVVLIEAHAVTYSNVIDWFSNEFY